MLLDRMGGRWQHRPILLLLLIGFFASGCNRSTMKLYPVKGKVTYKGQPANGAQIVFRPVNEAAEAPEASDKTPATPTATSYGTVDADGNFSLRTDPYGEGAPPGEYNVLITWNATDPEDPLSSKSKSPAKYADPSAPILKATVKEGPNELAPFNLK